MGKYFRLVDINDAKEKEFIFLSSNKNKSKIFNACNSSFKKIPGYPIAYWISEETFNCFNNPSLESFAPPKQGLITGDNDKFLRFWFECAKFNLSLFVENAKWFPFNKGGERRRWYGNRDYVINWENDGYDIQHFYDENGKLRSRPQNLNYNFTKGISWSLITCSSFSVREYDEKFLFNVAGISCFPNEDFYYFMGLLNSKISNYFLKIINPTLNTNVGDVAKLPIILINEKNEVEQISKRCVELEKDDWDSFEISWDYIKHPLIKGDMVMSKLISELYVKWEKDRLLKFNELKELEEKLNALFIKGYGLEKELSPNVDEKDITFRKAELSREIKSLISYAIGIFFGRYSLDKDGICYAGGKWNEDYYSTIIPDSDNIIPILDEGYSNDDALNKIINFVEKVYGKETLEENLKFISEALGGNGTSRENIRNYLINGFYNDHLKTYQKRPIYWLFDAGKYNSFKCLIYMHRYTPDLLAKIRTDYILPLLDQYAGRINYLEKEIPTLSGSSQTKARKELDKVRDQLKELSAYELKIHNLADQRISIDLDDGVKHNYELFKDVLAPIK